MKKSVFTLICMIIMSAVSASAKTVIVYNAHTPKEKVVVVNDNNRRVATHKYHKKHAPAVYKHHVDKCKCKECKKARKQWRKAQKLNKKRAARTWRK